MQIHCEQHARMLSGLHHAAARAMAGDCAAGREALRLLPQWLVFHIATMDQALVAALRRQDAQKNASRRASDAAVAPVFRLQSGSLNYNIH
jgi:hemerythrin